MQLYTLYKKYRYIISKHRYLAVFAIISVFVATMLEGTALLTLVPVLSGGISTGSYLDVILTSLIDLTNIRVNYTEFAVILFFIMAFFSATVKLISEILFLRFRSDTERDLRIEATNAIQNMEWPAYIMLKTGDIGKSIIIEGQQISTGAQQLLMAFSSFLAVMVYIFIAANISFDMTLVTLVFGFVAGLVYKYGSKYAKKHSDRLSGIIGSLGENIHEIFSNLKYLRISGKDDVIHDKTTKQYGEFANAFFWTYFYANFFRFLFELGGIFFISVFLFLNLVVYALPVGSIIVFLAVFYRLAPKLLALNDYLFQSSTFISWLDSWLSRVSRALNHSEKSGGKYMLNDLNSIVLQDVGLNYTESNINVLDNLNLKMHAGECIALIGHSGSGKTSLLDILTGLITPSSGKVLINDIDLQNIDVKHWRNKIGYVPQDAPLFSGTIAENIAFERKVKEEKITDSLRMANALDFVKKLPGGIDAQITENGSNFSGGERQRLAMARALYADPWIIILDEATSALDSVNEKIIKESLQKLKGKCTILMIAHRLKTLEIADRILVLESGHITETGSWHELANKTKSRFRKYLDAQELNSQ